MIKLFGYSLVTHLGTFGPVGWLPAAPGTWGSAVAAVLWWFWLSNLSPLYFSLALIPVGFLAIWIANEAERELGHDSKKIVIDEFIGQWITLMFCPKQIAWAAAGFFLFRFIDITKPFFVRRAEKLPGGWGIVIDDVLGGLAGMIIILALSLLKRKLLGIG